MIADKDASSLQIGAVRQTLLASLAKAFTLTRPPSTGPPQETTFFLPRADLEGLQAIEEKPLLTGKGKVRALPPDAHSAAIRGAWRVTSAEAEKLMRRVYVRHPNYSDIVPALLSSGLEGLEQQVRLTVGIPLSPMLGSITRSLAEVFERLSGVEFTSEAKLDGQRGQIHVRAVRDATEEKLVRQEVGSGGLWTALDDGRRVFCRLFSRHSEDMTEKVRGCWNRARGLAAEYTADPALCSLPKYPDIISLVKILLARPMPTLDSAAAPTPADPPLAALFQADRIDSFIFDCEIVALDKPTGAFRPFQELAGRAKKDVRIEDVKVEVGLFAFDLMLLNDQVRVDRLDLPPAIDADHCYHHRRRLSRSSSESPSASAATCSGRSCRPSTLPSTRRRSSRASTTSKASTRPTPRRSRPSSRRSSRTRPRA